MAFPVVINNQQVSSIRYDTCEDKAVIRAIKDLQEDIEKVTGVKPEIFTNEPISNYEIVIGTLGRSKLINQLVKSKMLSAKDLQNKWESFVISTIDDLKFFPRKSGYCWK